MGRLATLLFSLLALLSLSVNAAEPAPVLLKEQGHLLDRHGMIVTGKVTLTFALYFTPVGGRPLWQERHTLTPVNGAFSIMLGEARAFPPAVFDGGPLYLGVRLNGDAEVTPREELAGISPALIAGTSSRPSSPPFEGITPVALRSLWTQSSGANDESPARARVAPEVSAFTPANGPSRPSGSADRSAIVRQVTPASPFGASSVIASRLPAGDAHCPAGGTRLVTGGEETYVCDGAFAVVIGGGDSSQNTDARQVRPAVDPASAIDVKQLRPPAAAQEASSNVATLVDQRPPPETWVTCGESSCVAHAAPTPDQE
jgi:hypothetical protein